MYAAYVEHYEYTMSSHAGTFVIMRHCHKAQADIFLIWEAYVAFQSVSKSGCTNLPRIRIPRPGDPFLPFEDVSIVIKIDINKK